MPRPPLDKGRDRGILPPVSRQIGFIFRYIVIPFKDCVSRLPNRFVLRNKCEYNVDNPWVLFLLFLFSNQ
jgi:hypothetical protein